MTKERLKRAITGQENLEPLDATDVALHLSEASRGNEDPEKNIKGAEPLARIAGHWEGRQAEGKIRALEEGGANAPRGGTATTNPPLGSH